VGNLEEFNAVLTQHAPTFKADHTYTLILRCVPGKLAAVYASR